MFLPTSCSLHIMSAATSFTTCEVRRELLQLPADAAGVALPYALSPVEYSFQHFWNMRLSFIFKRGEDLQDSTDFMPTIRLRESFLALMRHYPLLCARVDVEPSTAAPFVSALDGGVAWVEAECSAPLSVVPLGDAFSGQDALPSGVQLLEPYDVLHPLITPLFRLQVTRFTCGGVVIAFNSIHHLHDACACFQMMRDWAELYHKQPMQLTHPPHFDRSWLRPTFWHSNPEALKHEAAQMRLLPSFGGFETLVQPIDLGKEPPLPSVVNCVLRFTADELKCMKKLTVDALTVQNETGVVNALTSSSDIASPVRWLSTFEVLSAHIVRCVHLARFTAGSAAASNRNPIGLTMPSNMRRRLNAPPGNFFGNAILPCQAYFPVEWINNTQEGEQKESQEDTCDSDNRAMHHAASELARLARVIHSSIAAASDPSHFQRTLSWLESHPRKDLISQCDDLQRGLIITAFHKFKPHHLDFQRQAKEGVEEDGAGDSSSSSVTMVAPLKDVEGMVILMDVPRQKGAIDAHISLLPQHMQRLCAIGGPLHAFRPYISDASSPLNTAIA